MSGFIKELHGDGNIKAGRNTTLSRIPRCPASYNNEIVQAVSEPVVEGRGELVSEYPRSRIPRPPLLMRSTPRTIATSNSSVDSSNGRESANTPVVRLATGAVVNDKGEKVNELGEETLGKANHMSFGTLQAKVQHKTEIGRGSRIPLPPRISSVKHNPVVSLAAKESVNLPINSLVTEYIVDDVGEIIREVTMPTEKFTAIKAENATQLKTQLPSSVFSQSSNSKGNTEAFCSKIPLFPTSCRYNVVRTKDSSSNCKVEINTEKNAKKEVKTGEYEDSDEFEVRVKNANSGKILHSSSKNVSNKSPVQFRESAFQQQPPNLGSTNFSKALLSTRTVPNANDKPMGDAEYQSVIAEEYNWQTSDAIMLNLSRNRQGETQQLKDNPIKAKTHKQLKSSQADMSHAKVCGQSPTKLFKSVKADKALLEQNISIKKQVLAGINSTPRLIESGRRKVTAQQRELPKNISDIERKVQSLDREGQRLLEENSKLRAELLRDEQKLRSQLMEQLDALEESKNRLDYLEEQQLKLLEARSILETSSEREDCQNEEVDEVCNNRDRGHPLKATWRIVCWIAQCTLPALNVDI